MTRMTYSFELCDVPSWDIDAWVDQITSMRLPTARRRRRIDGETDPVTVEYIDVPCAFDIETTSLTDEETGEKVAFMWVWQFGIGGRVVMGRRWDEFTRLLDLLRDRLGLSSRRRLICYIHFLGFEFQNFRKYLTWDEVFSLDVREPLYALSGGIEFRCSFKLSGYGLEKLGDELHTYNVHKKTGDLDYDLIRTSETPITGEEVGYCVGDVLVVMAYVQEEIERLGHITRLPLTKTGYVRKFCRKRCLYADKGRDGNEAREYRRMIRALVMTPDEYQQLKRAFAGGFTHASARYAGQTLHNVDSIDYTSAYPYVMIAYQYPMSAAGIVEHVGDRLPELLRKYCCLFDLRLTGLRPRINNDHYLSSSKCRYDRRETVVDNGRIVRSSWIETTVTDVDMRIIRRYYEWDKLAVANMRIYTRGYLPRLFVNCILDLYEDKTALRGIAEKVIEYAVAKGMLNALFGCCVMDPCRPEIDYPGEWVPAKAPNIEEAVARYNNDRTRFVSYAWGVWCTAYCRYNLLTFAAGAIRDDYVYADTDSIKMLHYELHAAQVERYNQQVAARLRRALDARKIDFDRCQPADKFGVRHMLGTWDHETADGKQYTRFKTLGAKRYMVDQSGKISLTVSGLNKKIAVPYLLKQYGPDGIFDAFDDGLDIPGEYTGKLVHTYIDDAMSGTCADYLGHEGSYDQLSGVHLSPCPYSLSMMQAYLDYILGMRDVVTT